MIEPFGMKSKLSFILNYLDSSYLFLIYAGYDFHLTISLKNDLVCFLYKAMKMQGYINATEIQTSKKED